MSIQLPCREPQRRSLRLASASPRRRLLLPLLGYPVIVTPTDTDERLDPAIRPDEIARRLARQKADAAARPSSGEVVVAADTIVALAGQQLGKPASAAEAQRMLEKVATDGATTEDLIRAALQGTTLKQERA